MKNHLSSSLHQFIHKYQLVGQKILIAVSTGVDSMVLLDLILKLKNKLKITLGVVHVNHGWRNQSDSEYNFLEKFCKENNISFFGKNLELSKSVKDAENVARKARYEFFQGIYENFEASGLFLAHHEGDLEETIVKRIYEGAFISHLGGMQESHEFLKMRVFRPLLNSSKLELIKYAQTYRVPYFEDETNHDPKFLRARLRLNYFPILETVFGKNKGSNLARLAKQSQLMNDFFDQRYEQGVRCFELKNSNKALVLKGGCHFFETLNFITIFFKRNGLSLSQAMIMAICQAIQSSLEPKEFRLKNIEIITSKGFLAMIDQNHSEDWLFLEKNDPLVAILPSWFYKKVAILKK